jgi:uncharacterized protein (DUF2147 family)
MRNFLLSALITLLSFGNVHSQTGADDIIGTWLTGTGKAHIKIDNIKGYYFGRIVWLKEPLNKEGKPKTDGMNPDISKQNLSLLGIRLLDGFEYKSENNWEKGTIYDPENGKTYSCKIYLENKNTMKIRGYLGISLIGRTDTWTRVK